MDDVSSLNSDRSKRLSVISKRTNKSDTSSLSLSNSQILKRNYHTCFDLFCLLSPLMITFGFFFKKCIFISAENIPIDLLLQEACMKNDITAVKHLITLDIDLNKKSQLGRSPIHWAIINNNTEIVELLVNAKCDIEASDKVSFSFFQIFSNFLCFHSFIQFEKKV